MFLHDYRLVCEISTVGTLALSHVVRKPDNDQTIKKCGSIKTDEY